MNPELFRGKLRFNKIVCIKNLNILFYACKDLVFSEILFVLDRIIYPCKMSFFCIYEKGDALQVTDYFQIFYRGLRMDFSLGGYIMMLACLITAFTPFVQGIHH